jgi:hypothetical protein
MYWTSLTPTSLSVPPFTGVPPALTAPPVAEPDAALDAVDDGADPLPLLVDPELLHAAASKVTATADAAPTACSRKCLATLFLLEDLPDEDRSP